MITFLLAVSSSFAAPSANLPAAASEPTVVATPETEQQSGMLVVDAHVPAEIIIDHVKLAQLWQPGNVRFEIVAGPRALTLYVAGQPQNVAIDIQPGKEVHVLVGRTGISVTQPEVTPAGDVQNVELELRVVGGGAVQVRLDGERHMLSGGDKLALTLPPGPHAMTVRSQDGTAIWAAGTLTLSGGAPVIVQIAEGRMPETSGPGRFDASSGGGG